jgi:hypothetical protein
MLFASVLLVVMLGTSAYIYATIPAPVDVDPVPSADRHDPWARSIYGLMAGIRVIFVLVVYEVLRSADRAIRRWAKGKQCLEQPGVRIDIAEPAK